MREVLSGKYAGEVKNYLFDFSSLVTPGDAFIGATATISLYSGLVGTLPSLVILATVNNVTTVQVEAGGTVGNIYVLVVTGTSTAGVIANLNAFLPILPGQP